ncbi:MAG: hypothetical protein ACOYOV_13300 [Bacteroidales bacterium]
MKKLFVVIAVIFVQYISFGQTNKQDVSKECFYKAYDALKSMLEGKDSLNYEKAVFITENAYHNNYFNYEDFKRLLDFHAGMINAYAVDIRANYKEKYKTLKPWEQCYFKSNTDNWAIFKYITDTAFVKINEAMYYKKPYSYTYQDPYGSDNWENTEVLYLLLSNEKQGNCYSLASLFKIFSDRLKSDARLTIAPHHIYIQNRNQRGDFYNVELASKSFPGDGTIQCLTYTTYTSIKNGMAQRMLNDKQAIALNLIYLAKAYQHKYNDNTSDFLLRCADLAYKYDSLSLNALLLKAEITENSLLASMKELKITTLLKARIKPQTQELLASYETQLSDLYTLGYREIPKDIERVILAKIQHREEGAILKDKTPNPFASIKAKQRYATLSNGRFDEIHEAVDSIQYYHAVLNTKTKKITQLFSVEVNTDYKVDPVVFALSVDPMSDKYPNISPYAYCHWNPIVLIDPNGKEDDGFVSLWDNNTSKYEKHKVNDLGGNKANYTEFKGGILNGQVQKHDLKNNTTAWFNNSKSEISPVTGSPTGNGALEDANWIIDLAAGGFKGLIEGGTEIAAKSISNVAENLADDAVKGGAEIIEQTTVHGNSLLSNKPTWGYKLFSQDGTFLKNGITSAVKAESRYTKAFMSDKVMFEKTLFPNRAAAYKWEFGQNQILRGPLNFNMH